MNPPEASFHVRMIASMSLMTVAKRASDGTYTLQVRFAVSTRSGPTTGKFSVFVYREEGSANGETVLVSNAGSFILRTQIGPHSGNGDSLHLGTY